MKRKLPALLLALAAVAACKDGTGSGPQLTALRIEPSTYYLAVGDTVRLVASGTDDQHQAVSVTTASYKSTNPSVASVAGDGKVTAVSVGTAQIIGKAGGQTDTATINVLASSSIKTFNVDAVSATGCDAPVYHGARQVASASHVVIYEDLNNPAGGFTTAEYQSIADEFDAKIYPTDVANFGTPTDLDQNGKVIILYTRAVNEMTPAGANFIIGGFYYSRDLFPRTAQPGFRPCPTSNYGEMFYMLAPDPTGTINQHVRSKTFVRQSTLSTTAHELQHLINASRRLYVNNAPDFETVWLDEGLAHVAEELTYYAESGYAPRQNLAQAQILASQAQLDIFNEFQVANTGRYHEYLVNPPANSPYANNDDLETRGATWDFLRYAADRRNGNDQAFWFALVNSTSTGMTNLTNALGTDPVAWARDWSVSVYTDDAVPVAAQFTQPSWNYRDIFRNSGLGGVYPLQVQTLVNGTASVTVKSGSAAYYKFAVAAGQTGDVRVAQTGTTVGAGCTAQALTVGQVVQVTMGTAGVQLCPSGGAAGAEFVVIPFYGSSTSDATIPVTLTAANVTTPVGPPNPDRMASAGVSPFPLDGLSLQRPYDGGFELRLRKQERRLLQMLRPNGGAGPRSDVANVEGPAGVTVNLVRTK
jgi:hypothetical protein